MFGCCQYSNGDEENELCVLTMEFLIHVPTMDKQKGLYTQPIGYDSAINYHGNACHQHQWNLPLALRLSSFNQCERVMNS